MKRSGGGVGDYMGWCGVALSSSTCGTDYLFEYVFLGLLNIINGFKPTTV